MLHVLPGPLTPRARRGGDDLTEDRLADPADLARTLALGAADGRGARGRSRATAGLAVDGRVDVDVLLDAEDRVPKGQAHDDLGVGTRDRTGAPATAGPGHPAEESVEQVGEVAAEGVARSARARPEHAVDAEAVVVGAPLGILQDLVGKAHLFELIVGLRAAVGMGLSCLGPVGAFELLVGRVASDAEHLVEVAGGHRDPALNRSPSR